MVLALNMDRFASFETSNDTVRVRKKGRSSVIVPTGTVGLFAIEPDIGLLTLNAGLAGFTTDSLRQSNSCPCGILKNARVVILRNSLFSSYYDDDNEKSNINIRIILIALLGGIGVFGFGYINNLNDLIKTELR